MQIILINSSYKLFHGIQFSFTTFTSTCLISLPTINSLNNPSSTNLSLQSPRHSLRSIYFSIKLVKQVYSLVCLAMLLHDRVSVAINFHTLTD